VKEKELWITNISMDHDEVIGDLRLTIRSGQSINLLGKKPNGKPKFLFTEKQVYDSIKSGSISKKSDIIKIRQVAPVRLNHIINVSDDIARIYTRVNRKHEEMVIENFPDLELEDTTEEDAALENADLDFADREPILAVDPKFK
jgi:energy-coupling factor transporter ATP-binding protein EcfA2